MSQAIRQLSDHQEPAQRLEAKSAEFLTIPEVAGILRVSRWTLLAWRQKGEGPPFVKLARLTIRYPRRGLLRYLRNHLQGEFRGMK